jgi:hypothetical protein
MSMIAASILIRQLETRKGKFIFASLTDFSAALGSHFFDLRRFGRHSARFRWIAIFHSLLRRRCSAVFRWRFAGWAAGLVLD